MSEKMYEELALERAIKEKFGLVIDIYKPILFKVPISRTGEATLFLTQKKQLFLFVTGQAHFLLSDIKRIVSRMGLKAEAYLPPKGRPNYFEEFGVRKFKEVFPGRSHVSEADIHFYKTLTPYNTALIQISEVKDGQIYQFDADTQNGWRASTKFAYRRIRTS